MKKKETRIMNKKYIIDRVTKSGSYVVSGDRFGARKAWGSMAIDAGPGMNYHIGVDYGTPSGTKLYAPADGEFVKTCRDGHGNGYGNYILFYMPTIDKTVHLAHLNHIEWYEGKGLIKEGTYIGNSGNTGLSSGPHLHLGIAQGKKTNLGKGRFKDGTWLNPSTIDFTNIPKVADKPKPQENNLKFVPEKGFKFIPDRAINIRDYPSTKKGKVLDVYYKGEAVHYDGYVVNEGYIWLYYTFNGKKRYVCSRPNGGTRWGTFKAI